MQGKLIELPHTVCRYTCTINGIMDVYQWQTGQRLPSEFMMITSGMADFIYLKHKRARPPFMVFWGQGLKQQYENLERIFELKIEIKEGRSFNFALGLVKEEIDEGNPVVIGPLDMFYLEYRPEFFQRVHAFPHFALAVGYNDLERGIFLHDCDLPGVQPLSYESLRLAWQRDEPGYIKRNAVITFSVPGKPLPFKDLVKRGLLLKAEQMLNPPVRSWGLPGMRKLAQEFSKWGEFLSEEDYRSALENLAMYANTPPTLAPEIDNFTGRRKEFSGLLRELAVLTGIKELEDIAKGFAASGELISRISHIILDWLKGEKDSRAEIPELLLEVADIEQEGYLRIKGILKEDSDVLP